MPNKLQCTAICAVYAAKPPLTTPTNKNFSSLLRHALKNSSNMFVGPFSNYVETVKLYIESRLSAIQSIVMQLSL